MTRAIDALLRRAADEQMPGGIVPLDTMTALAGEGYILDALDEDVELYGDD